MSKKSMVSDGKLAVALPKNVRNNNGSYEFRKTVRGTVISITNKNLDALMKEAEKAVTALKNNQEYKKQNLTYAEWFDEWFGKVKAQKVKITSVASMKRLADRTFKKYMGDKKVKDIIPMTVQEAINEMIADGIAASQIRRALSNCRECFDFAVANKYTDINPTIQIEVPWPDKITEKEIPLTIEEQDAFLDYIDNEKTWYRELFYFMLLTGVRVGEVGGITWDCIDFKRKMIRIKQSLSCNYLDGNKTMVMNTPKTDASYREVPFMGEIEEMLLSQKNKVDQLRKELGSRWRAPEEMGDIVFVTTMGSPCTRYIVQKELNKIVDRINFERDKDNQFRHIHPHLLRHTFCTRCFECGIEPKAVQKWAGHSSYTVTMTIYTHVLEKMQEEQSKKLLSAHSVIKIEEKDLGKIILPKLTAHSIV